MSSDGRAMQFVETRECVHGFTGLVFSNELIDVGGSKLPSDVRPCCWYVYLAFRLQVGQFLELLNLVHTFSIRGDEPHNKQKARSSSGPSVCCV